MSPAKGNPRKILFICSKNRLRSRTAEDLYMNTDGIEVRSAGFDDDAVVQVTEEHIAWADVVFVFEKRHLQQIRKRFRKQATGRRIVCLHIPDQFDYMDPRLVLELKLKLAEHLGLPAHRK